MRKSLSLVFLLFIPLTLTAASPKLAAPSMGSPSGSGGSPAPTTHQNQFTCTPSIDSTTSNPGTTNMYKISGNSCPSATPTSTSGFTKLQTGVAPNCSATDTAVTPGQSNAYVFTATIGGLESGPSNCVTLVTPTFPTSSLTGTAY